MKFVKPAYYHLFRCAAADCPLTCCAGWQIDIDPDSLERYGNLRGEFGYEVKNAVDWMDNCFLQNEKGCLLQTENGLCRIQQQLGEEALCLTCRSFPRHEEEYPSLREYSLSLSCPAAAIQILCENPEQPPVETESEEEETLEFEDFDPEAFTRLLQLRDKIFKDALENREHTYEAFRNKIWKAAGAEEPAADFHSRRKETLKMLESLTVITSRWPALLSEYRRLLLKTEKLTPEAYRTLQQTFQTESSTWEYKGKSFPHILQNLLLEILRVQLPGAIYDGTAKDKAALAIFFTDLILDMVFLRWCADRSQASLTELSVLISILSREIEHDDDNLRCLSLLTGGCNLLILS